MKLLKKNELHKLAKMDAVKKKKGRTSQSKVEANQREKTSPSEELKEMNRSVGIGALFALEERIMFDAAAFATGAEIIQEQVTQEHAIQEQDSQILDTNTERDTSSNPFTDNVDLVSALSTVTTSFDRNEIVFIDTNVEGYQTLLEGIDSQAEVILLDSTKDGIEQMANVLQGKTGIDAIHLISHGEPGELRVGTGVLNLTSMQREYADELVAMNQALTDEADFLFYGCNFGEGQIGKATTARLAQLTGADVAASSDLTGSTGLGGDWDLEVETGKIETVVVVDAEVQLLWSGTLADTTVSFQEGVDGYASTQDTHLEEDTPTTSYGSQTTVEVDLQNSGLGEEQAIIRFDNLFGSGAGQIPLGSTILSATLTLDGVDTSQDTATMSLHRMLATWSESSTWNSLASGISTDDIEAASIADAVIANPEIIEAKVLTDLESTVQAWSDGATNYGWMLKSDSTDGWFFTSSEDSNVNLRPKLTVEYRTSGGDISSGLSGHWTFDANANDSSGNNYHGTLTNGAAIDTTDLTDQVGFAKLSLDGTDDYVDLASHVSNFNGLNEGTISAWIKTTSNAAVETIFSISDAGDNQSYAQLSIKNGALAWDIEEDNVDQIDVDTNVLVNDGSWHHVAISVSTSGNSLYIDGQRIADLNYSVGSSSSANFFNDVSNLDAMAIGRNINNSTGEWFFNGLIDDVRVYNTALSVADIAALAAEAPVATNDSATTNINTAVNINVIANDTDLDSETITALDVGNPTNGLVVNDEDGTVTYTPNTSYTGGDRFTYLAADLDDTVSYWRLDGNGTDAVASNNGTLTGTSPVTGVYGNALMFDEMDDKVVVPDFAVNNEFSVSFKFKVDDNTGPLFQYIYSHGDINGTNSLNIFLNEASHGTDPNLLRTVIRDTDDTLSNTALEFDASSIIGDGQWHTYTLTVASGAGSKVYLDGILQKTDSTRGGGSFNPTTDLYFGAKEDLDANRLYGGSLDSVQLFNRALSAEEVNDAHTGGSSVGTVNVTVEEQDTDGDSVANSIDLDDDNDGILDVVEDANAFNVFSASFEGTLAIGTEQTLPTGLAVSNDGTKLYVIGQTGDEINQYTLTTVFDVTGGATFDGVALVGTEESQPEDLVFSADGTKLFIVGSGGDEVNQYTLTTAFDLTAGLTQDGQFSVAGQETDSHALRFNNDGTKLYVLGQSGDDINQYSLTTAFDITSGVTFDGSPFSVAGQETTPTAFAFNADGSQLFVLGTTGDDINVYTLNTAFDLTAGAVFVNAFSIAGEEVTPEGIAFSPDGDRLYVIGNTGDDVSQYSINIDADGDGVKNSLDLDSDNDGITDNVEAQSTAGYLAPSGTGSGITDADGDGLDDNYDANTADATAAASIGLTPVDTDSDSFVDTLDTDSDNDGTSDTDEAGHGISQAAIDASADTDNDGLKDVVEGANSSDGFDVNDENLDGTDTNFLLADTDNDTAADGSDAAPTATDLDYRDDQLDINTLVVDTTSDVSDGDTSSIAALLAAKGADGLISLREAITATNNTTNGTNPDEIHFNISAALVGGAHTIQVGNVTDGGNGAFPDITDAVIIDGTTDSDFSTTPIIVLDGSSAGTSAEGITLSSGSSSSTIRGLVINQFDLAGLRIDNSDSNTIVGNYVGTDVTGMSALANTDNGIEIVNGAQNNTIGGTTTADRNIISGNSVDGVRIRGGADGNIIIGNYIGVDATGTGPLGNSDDGIELDATGSDNNTIGGAAANEGNVIAFNSGDGVNLSNIGARGNSFLGNSVYSNTGIGIDLNNDGVTSNDPNDVDTGTGANNLQNFPLLTSAVTTGTQITINGSLDTNLLNQDYRIEFFSNATSDGSGNGEGRRFLGAVTVATDGSGDATISEVLNVSVAFDAKITATATVDNGGGSYGDTSEFAVNISATGSSILTVDTTSDISDGDTTSIADLLADKGVDGLISLREAIIATNNTTNGTNPDEIHFNITGVGPHTITPGSVLPTITDSAIIDGYTQSGASANTLSVGSDAVLKIEIDGSLAGTVDGLSITAGNSTIRGLAIHSFDNDGIALATNDGNVIEGNFIGTNATGTALGLGNSDGVDIDSASSNNTIGGATAAARNIISGNTNDGVDIENVTGNVVIGNYIGTNAAGTADLGNTNYGVNIKGGASSNTIGGTATNARNIISGNNSGGIEIDNSTSNVIEGNYIGTNAAGTTGIGNTFAGIRIDNGASSNTIGGTTTNARNVISGNSGDGIYLTDSGTDNNVIQGNFIGTTAAGTAALANTDRGIQIESSAASTQIGGTAAGAGNVISGNSNDGIHLGAAAGASNTIQGNTIGTNATGTAALGNGDGLDIRNTGTIVGGTTANARNIISGNNQHGIYLLGDSNTIQGNYIGVGANGVTAIGNNFDGISIQGNADDNLIGGTVSGAGNLIANNTQDGVALDSLAGTGNSILLNNIHSNTGIGIDLNNDGVTSNDPNDADTGTGPNNLQNFPVLTEVDIDSPTQITVGGTLDTDGLNQDYRIEFFKNTIATGEDPTNHGEGEIYLGFITVTTDGSGDATFSTTLTATVAAGEFVTATATVDNGGGSYGDTSEFALNVTAVAVNDAPVAADDRPGLVFDGVDDFVQLGSDASLEMTSTMTMEAWFRPTSLPTTSAGTIILNKEGEYEVGLDIDGSLRWAFANTDPGWTWHDTGHVVVLNEWTHVAVSHNSGTVITYINGSPVDTYNGSGSIGDAHATLDDLRIGGRSNNPTGQYFEGSIGEVRIWNTVRTGGEVSTNYDQLLVGNEAGLVANLRLREGSGTTATDLSSSGNDGTLGGGVVLQEPTWVGYSTDQNTALNIVAAGVLINDTDAESDPLVVSEVNGSAVNVGNQITLSSGALVTLNANGSFTYDPNGQFDSLSLGQQASDQFTYTADDGNSGSDTATVDITITGLNDAPTVGNGSLASILEDDTNPPGATISSMFSGSFNDVDTGSSIAGIAITSNNAPAGEGVWQYSTDGGTAWFDIGTVSGLQSLSLNASTLIRFLPALNYNGSPTVLSLRALDNTYGGGFTSGATQVDVDTTSPGGTSPISSSLVSLSTSVTAVNDQPTVGTNTGLTVIEGGSVVITNAMVNEGDPDDSGVGITYRAVGDTANGSLFVGGVALIRNDTFTQADIDNGIVVYKHTGGERSAESFRLGISDGGEDGTSEVFFNVSIAVTAANDAPVAGNDPSGTATDIITDPDTVGFWRLGESSGLTAVDETGSHDGTYNNITLGATGVTGSNTAADFNGTNSYVDLGNLDVAGSGITMAAWINADSFGTADGRIFGKADGAFDPDHTWMLSVIDQGADVLLRVRISAGGYTETLIADSPNLSTGQWYHVAATYASGTGEMALYVDGQQVELGEHSVGGAVDQDSSRSVWIGGSPVGGNYFDGRIDEAVLMQRSMSASEVAALAELAPPDYSVSEDGIMSVNATNGVLQNDSDVEGDAMTVTQVNGLAMIGSQISLASGALLTVNADGRFDYDPNGQFESLVVGQSATETFTYTVSDGSATDTGTAEITITGENDAPVLDSAGAMVLTDINEDDFTSTGDTVANIIASAQPPDRITDADAGAVEGFAVVGADNTNGTWEYNAGAGWTGFGAVTNTNAVLLDTTSSIRFVPNANYAGSAGAVTFRAWDVTVGMDGDTGVDVSTSGGVTAYSTVTETATLNVDAVNDAPTFTATGSDPTYPEGGSAVGLFSGTAISTVEAGQTITGMTFTVTNVTDAGHEQITIDGTTITLDNGQAGSTTDFTYSVAVSGTTATVTLSGGTASVANVVSDVDTMTYINTSQDPTDANRVVTFTEIVDSGGTANGGADTGTPVAVSTVDVDAVNDAPVVGAPAGPLAATEQTNLSIAGTGFMVSDVDAASGTLSTTLTVGEGTLTVVEGDSGVTISSGNGTGTVVLTGTVTQINTLFTGSSTGTITYFNSSDAPMPATTLTVTVNDQGNMGMDPGLSGDGSSEEDTNNVMINIMAVNDAPIITSDGGGPTAAINVAENQTAVTTVTATDPDVPPDTLTYTIIGGADAAQFSINGSSGAVTFITAPNFEVPADANLDGIYEVTVQVSDGNGGFDTQAISVMVTDVSDAPIITSDGGGPTAAINAAENQTAVTTVTATDPDVLLDTLTYTIIGGADAAQFSINGSSGAVTFITAPDFEVPADANLDGVYEVTVQVSDGNGGTDTQVISVTVMDLQEGLPTPPPDPTPPPPPDPTPSPLSDPVPVIDSETSGSFLTGYYGRALGRGLDPEEQFDREHEVVEILNLPPFLPVAGAMTPEQIRAYYPDPLALAKAKLPLEFLQQLNKFSDELGQAMEDEVSERSWFVSTIKGVGFSLTAGFVAWMLRGGALLASLLASLPVWRQLDPIPILGMDNKERQSWTRRVKEANQLEAHQHQGLEKILQPNIDSVS